MIVLSRQNNNNNEEKNRKSWENGKRRTLVRAQKRRRFPVRHPPPASSCRQWRRHDIARALPRAFLTSRRPVCTPRCPWSDAPVLHVSFPTANVFLNFFFFYVHYRCRQQRRRTTTRFFAYPPNQCRVITFGRLLHAEQRNRTKIEDRLAALPYRKTIIKKKYIVSANDGVSIDRIIICYCLLLFFFFNYYIYICLKNLRTITCRRTGVTDRHTAADGDGVVRSGLTLCVTASRWRRFLFERYEMWPRPQSGWWCFRRWWCRPSTQCWRWAVAQDRVGYNWSPSCGRCTCWTTRRRRSPRYHLLYESVSFSNDNGFTIVIIFYWNPRLSISD